MSTDSLPPLNEDADETIQSQSDGTVPYSPPQSKPTPHAGTQRMQPTRQQSAQRSSVTQQTRPQHAVNPRVTSTSTVYRPITPKRRPQDSSLYLPWWSLVLMLIAVLVLALLVVGLVLALGGNAPMVQPAPIIRIVTGEPTIPGAAGSSNSGNPVTPGTVVIAGEQAPDTLQMSGPTLPPVVFSPTPQLITVGSQVQVDGVGTNQLNVRERAGRIDSEVVFLAPLGTTYNIVAGPAQADGFTWWQIQNPLNVSETGWAASNYLVVPPTTP
ncbi:MAG: hypothetical protein ACPG7F_05155 [Aggregatilineales bacterium]